MALGVQDITKFTEIMTLQQISKGIRKIIKRENEGGVITPGSATPCISLINHIGNFILSLDEEQGRVLCPLFLSLVYSYVQYELSIDRNLLYLKGFKHVSGIFMVVLGYILMIEGENVLYKEETQSVVKLLNLVPTVVPLKTKTFYTCYIRAIKGGFGNNKRLIKHLVDMVLVRKNELNLTILFATCLLCSIYCGIQNKDDIIWRKVEDAILHVASNIIKFYIKKNIENGIENSQKNNYSKLEGINKLRVLKFILQVLNGEDIAHHVEVPTYDFMLSIADVINRNTLLNNRSPGPFIKVVELLVILFTRDAKPFEDKVNYVMEPNERYQISNISSFLRRLFKNCPSVPNLLYWLLTSRISFTSEVTVLIFDIVVKFLSLSVEDMESIGIPSSIIIKISPKREDELKFTELDENDPSKTISKLYVSNLFTSSRMDSPVDYKEVIMIKKMLKEHHT